MIEAATNRIESWQRLYRALLRSSAASVRFSRPAARNTRRYLRDEFAGALLVVQHNETRSGVDSWNVEGGSKNDEASVPTVDPNQPSSSSVRSQSPRDERPVGFSLRQQAHNTLAFHLSASLLPSGATKHPRASKDRLIVSRSPSSPEMISSAPCSANPPGPAREPLAGAARSSDRDRDRGTHTTGPDVHAARPTKPSRLAHRIIANLASLTYHHLSPHTQMQSRAHLKSNRALRKPKRLSSLARVLGKVEAADLSLDGGPGSTEAGLEGVLSSSRGSHQQDEEMLQNAAHMKLGFLMPTVKPVRGPLSARLKEWDGQDASKVPSEGNLRQMEADLVTIERLLTEHSGARTGSKPAASKQVQQLQAEAEQLRKKIKSTAKALALAEAQKQLDNVPIQHLADLIAAAQDSEQVLLGKNRWTRRKNGDFLPA